MGIGRGPRRSRDGGARGVEHGRTHGVNRTIIEVVTVAEWVREVRHGPADRLLQLRFAARNGALLLRCRTIPKPDVIDRVGANRRGVAGRQLAKVLAAVGFIECDP